MKPSRNSRAERGWKYQPDCSNYLRWYIAEFQLFKTFLIFLKFSKTFLNPASSLIYKARKRGAVLNDEDLKKMIVTAGSLYEPDKGFIEKLFNSILSALKSLRQKKEDKFVEEISKGEQADKPP